MDAATTAGVVTLERDREIATNVFEDPDDRSARWITSCGAED